MKGIGNAPKGELEIEELEIECGCADAQHYPLQQVVPALCEAMCEVRWTSDSACLASL